jgi:hypothetical protein
MNRISLQRILLLTYSFIAGAVFGWGVAFLILTPLFQLLLAAITGSDRGVLWTNYFVYMIFVVSIIGGIYIGEKWCLSYLARKDRKKSIK